MDDAAVQLIVERARAGDAEAQETLATLLAGEGHAEEARRWAESAARAGRGSALARLGLWDIAGFGAPVDPKRGVARILAGANGGDGEAMHTAAMLLAGGIGVPVDAQQGLRWLIGAARAGHARAATQIGILIGAGHAQISTAEPDSVDLSWVNSPFKRTVEHESPHIETLADFLPRSICDYVIRMAAPSLQRGKIFDRDGKEQVSGQRSNAVMNFGLANSDFLLELISQRTAHAAGMPPENAEGLGVLHYLPGESYAPHIDYHVETPANAALLAQRGQRARTLLVYLNEGFEGGETEFPRLGKRFKPPAGSALIFHSVDASGRGDPMTVHTGRPPTRGEKWIISKWFRTKALRPGPAK